MNANQMAIAAGTDLKWIQNASGLLKLDIRVSPQEARLWGLIRILVSAFDCPLKTAYSVASKALKSSLNGTGVRVFPDETGTASIVVDMNRFESIFNANLSRALMLETPRRRGRPPLSKSSAVQRARNYGIDISLLVSSLQLSPAQRLERLNANAEFLHTLRANR